MKEKISALLLAAAMLLSLAACGETAAAPDLAYLRQSLERDFFALTVTDETVPPHDLWQRVGEDSLAGRFLRRMQRRIESARTEEEKKMLLRAVRCGIAALEGWEVRP